MVNTILLIGTLDTKGTEYAYVRELILADGLNVLTMDAGVLGEPAFEPDVDAGEVAAAGGSSLEELRTRRDRGEAVEVMIRGVRRLVPQLYEEGRIHGVLALGGGGGTSLATAAMRELPVGVPKLMVSTMASGDVSPYLGGKDITLMYSVVDIAGLNPLSRRILANAAGAICGMVRQEVPEADDRPIIAASMFGVTTPCVNRVRERMEEAGYEVLVFHATGSGGRSMEGLIRDGYVAGVADVTTTEWCDEVVGGVLSAGPTRLTAAGESGVPQVVSCGALDMVNFGAFASVPDPFKERNLYRHNPNVTLMRTTPDECREIGRRIAQHLSAASGRTVLMLPLKGVSMLDDDGEPFFDPEADAALFDALREHAGPSVDIVELDLHINDPAFADAIADRLLELMA
ncbi:MAG: Tm-1-like ATP-binding domain-containing protein [Rhodothermales bacterium]